MKAPPYRFPGMDPWLERPGFWGPFHVRLLTDLANNLTAQIAPRYIAIPQERLVIEDPPRRIQRDVAVLESRAGRRSRRSICAVAVEEPVVVLMESEPIAQHFIEIRDLTTERRLVTVVEVISPTNKAAGGDGRQKYLAKQVEVLASDVNLVEIDLLRGGHHTVALAHAYVPHSHYRVVIRRSKDRKRGEIYPISVRQRLPRVRIPLRAPDADAAADLQELVEKVYRDGWLGELVDYSIPPEPPLEDPDARWARELLSAKPVRR